MDNQTIYKDINFTITKELFISGNTRFALQHLCSIKLEKAYKQFPYTLCVIAIILISVGLYLDFKFNSLVVAIGCLGVIGSILLFILRKPVHKIFLVFSSGETEVIGNTDYSYLEKLAYAFSRSIAERQSTHYNEKTIGGMSGFGVL
jgi:hypothetical protein